MNESFTALARPADIPHASLRDTVAGSDRFKVSPTNFATSHTTGKRPGHSLAIGAPDGSRRGTRTAGPTGAGARHTRAQFFGNSCRPFRPASGYGDGIPP